MKRALLFTSILWCAAGCGGEDPPLTISVFTSSASAVARGRPVTLAWSVQNADTITLLREPDTVILENHPVLEGSQQSEPLDRSTAFTLIAIRGDEKISETLRVTALGSGERVSISTFGADPTSARRGEPVTLSWSTVAASGAAITDSDGNTIEAQAATPSGTLQVTPRDTTTYVLEALGPGGPVRAETTVTVRAPSVEIFAATPAGITLGESSELTWAVRLATNVTIVDEMGSEIFSGADLSGSVRVMPTATTIYTITATDDGGAEATAMTTVTVTEPVQAEVISFTAAPTNVDIGEPSVLTWSVRNAPGGIAIEAGGSVLLRSVERTGTHSIVQATSTTYQLTAFSSGGNAMQSVTVASNPSPPAILELDATPMNVVTNGSTSISWTTLGATSLEIFRGDVASGTLEYTATNDVGGGAISAVVTAPMTTFTVRARNANGPRVRTVMVRAFDPPRIVGLTVTPLTFSSTPTQVSLGWSTADSANVELFVGGARDTSFPGTTVGNHAVTISRSTIFELVASNPAASVSRTVVVAATIGETEPNDTAATAFQGVTNGGNTPASIATETDVDWFEVTVPAGGGVRAETSDGMSGCGIDTVLRFYRREANGATTLLGENDEGGVNGCSLIDRQVDAFARDLVAGTYYVSVHSESGVGSYTLSLSIASPSCPNGIQEINNPAGAEQCDDNNSIDTDACNNLCQRNIDNIGTLTGVSPFPGGASTFNGQITPIGRRQFVTIDLSSVANGAYLMARTYAAAEPLCTADTALELYDENFQLIGTNDQSGVDDCSVIDPGLDGTLQPFADLPRGTYYLGIGEFGDNATIPAYQVRVRAETKNRCGNRVVETGEQCDDGQSAAVDSCDNSCMFAGVLESEPNDSAATSDDPMGASVIRGRIATPGDVDWYRIALPDQSSLLAETSDGLGGCAIERGALRSVLTLYSEAPGNPGTLTMLGTVDGNRNGCALIDGRDDAFAQSLDSANNYYLRVGDPMSTVTGIYELAVTAIAPGCGNRIVEAGERCDDGNTATGDGCDASCSFELASTVTATGAAASTDTMTIPVGGFSAVRVQAAAGTDVRVVTSDVGGTSCTIDTTALIVDDTGALLVAEEDGALAPGTCAEIDPTVATSAANLAGPATYYVLIFNDGLGAITAQTVTTLLP